MFAFYSDLRSSNCGHGLHRELRLGVDAFWHFCYHHIAQPLAHADPKALGEEVGSGARVLECVAGTNGKPLAGATLDLYHNAARKYMPAMTWPEVFQMYCLTADATPGRGSLKLVKQGVQGVLGADPWLSLYRAAREVHHVREAGEDSQGFARHG